MKLQMDSGLQTLGLGRHWIQWPKDHRSQLSELGRTHISTHPAMKATSAPAVGPACVACLQGWEAHHLTRKPLQVAQLRLGEVLPGVAACSASPIRAALSVQAGPGQVPDALLSILAIPCQTQLGPWSHHACEWKHLPALLLLPSTTPFPKEAHPAAWPTPCSPRTPGAVPGPLMQPGAVLNMDSRSGVEGPGSNTCCLSREPSWNPAAYTLHLAGTPLRWCCPIYRPSCPSHEDSLASAWQTAQAQVWPWGW